MEAANKMTREQLDKINEICSKIEKIKQLISKTEYASLNFETNGGLKICQADDEDDDYSRRSVFYPGELAGDIYKTVMNLLNERIQQYEQELKNLGLEGL